MTPFTYHRAATASEAAQQAGAAGKYLGGGTNLVDLMRETIERPAALVDVTGLDSAIAEQLGLSTRSVDAHVNAIYQALEVRSSPHNNPRVTAVRRSLAHTARSTNL